MGDAGEGLVDAESRLAERMEEREQEKRRARQASKGGDPEQARQLESLRLARVAQHLAHGGANDVDGVAPAGEATERSRNGDGHGHRHTSLRTSSDSGCIWGRSSSRTQLARSAERPPSMRTIR